MALFPPMREKDPWDWSAVMAVFFLALVWHRIGIPSVIYFDEVHYVKSARLLIDFKSNNPEHPPLGKEVIAAMMLWLGDKPMFWRLPSVVFGTVGLFAFARVLWLTSASRFATLAGQFLLATSFAWFVQSRIAMLDMMMAGLLMIALWLLAGAMRFPERGRWRLALAGVMLGLSLGVKWSVAPVIVLIGATFVAMKLKTNGARFLTARSDGPVAGISLIEAGFWLGVLPLAVYWASYWPTFLYTDRPVDPWSFWSHHKYMLELQDSVRKLHPYRSVWWQWVINERAIWYLYLKIDGAQRGVMLIGNPFSMLAGLPGLVWCLWAAWFRRMDALAFALLYLVSIGFWIVTSKPIQFYYHYLLPGTFLMGCLALALDELYRRGRWMAWIAWASLAVAGGMFAWFYPVLSAAKLSGPQAFTQWTWIDSWR